MLGAIPVGEDAFQDQQKRTEERVRDHPQSLELIVDRPDPAASAYVNRRLYLRLWIYLCVMNVHVLPILYEKLDGAMCIDADQSRRINLELSEFCGMDNIAFKGSDLDTFRHH